MDDLDDLDGLQTAADTLLLNADLAMVLFEQSPDAILMIAANGTIVLANRQAELLTGYPRSELQGMSVDLLVPTEARERHEGHRSRFIDEPRARPMGVGTLDLVLQRKNGSIVPVDINLSPVVLTQGTFVIDVIRRRRDP